MENHHRHHHHHHHHHHQSTNPISNNNNNNNNNNTNTTEAASSSSKWKRAVDSHYHVFYYHEDTLQVIWQAPLEELSRILPCPILPWEQQQQQQEQSLPPNKNNPTMPKQTNDEVRSDPQQQHQPPLPLPLVQQDEQQQNPVPPEPNSSSSKQQQQLFDLQMAAVADPCAVVMGWPLSSTSSSAATTTTKNVVAAASTTTTTTTVNLPQNDTTITSSDEKTTCINNNPIESDHPTKDIIQSSSPPATISAQEQDHDDDGNNDAELQTKTTASDQVQGEVPAAIVSSTLVQSNDQASQIETNQPLNQPDCQSEVSTIPQNGTLCLEDQSTTTKQGMEINFNKDDLVSGTQTAEDLSLLNQPDRRRRRSNSGTPPAIPQNNDTMVVECHPSNHGVVGNSNDDPSSGPTNLPLIQRNCCCCSSNTTSTTTIPNKEALQVEGQSNNCNNSNDQAAFFSQDETNFSGHVSTQQPDDCCCSGTLEIPPNNTKNNNDTTTTVEEETITQSTEVIIMTTDPPPAFQKKRRPSSSTVVDSTTATAVKRPRVTRVAAETAMVRLRFSSDLVPRHSREPSQESKKKTPDTNNAPLPLPDNNNNNNSGSSKPQQDQDGTTGPEPNKPGNETTSTMIPLVQKMIVSKEQEVTVPKEKETTVAKEKQATMPKEKVTTAAKEKLMTAAKEKVMLAAKEKEMTAAKEKVMIAAKEKEIMAAKEKEEKGTPQHTLSAILSGNARATLSDIVLQSTLLVTQTLANFPLPESQNIQENNVSSCLVQFAKDVIIPAMMKMTFKNNGSIIAEAKKVIPIILGTLLLLREVMVQNAHFIYGEELWGQDLDEEQGSDLFSCLTLTTAILMASLEKITKTNLVPLFTRVMDSYDDGEEEFAKLLGTLENVDDSSLPEMDPTERTLWTASYNFWAENHPVRLKHRLRQAGMSVEPVVQVPTNHVHISIRDNVEHPKEATKKSCDERKHSKLETT